jgi:hypothetical protein
MSKLPYGGFEASSESAGDDGWAKLYTIVEYLEAGELVPPYLAHWVGQAIERSAGNPDELLRLLALRKRRGKPREKFTEEFELQIGRYICGLEDSGLRPDKALKEFKLQYQKHYENRFSLLEKSGLTTEQAEAKIEEEISWNPPSLTTLKKWRNNYRQLIENHE